MESGRAPAAGIGAGEKIVLAADRNHPIILPISGRKLKSITPGTRSTGAGSGGITASSASAVGLFTSR
jgi:hypothetical protein